MADLVRPLRAGSCRYVGHSSGLPISDFRFPISPYAGPRSSLAASGLPAEALAEAGASALNPFSLAWI
jgi:hypothetical protein